MREAFGRLAGGALRALFLAERRCPGCGQTLQPVGQNGRWTESALCPDCLDANRPPENAPCPGCGEYPSTPLAAPVLCLGCRSKPRPWGRLVAYGPYDGRLRELILAYKFENRLDLGRQLQEFVCAAFERGAAAHPELAQCELLVPVPLHPRRLTWRGFNQSRELARLLSARRGLPIEQRALMRVRRTTPQVELKREARAENIRGAFQARKECVAGRPVLLVDDIMTTGATLEECARALLAAGAVRVDVLVLARA